MIKMRTPSTTRLLAMLACAGFLAQAPLAHAAPSRGAAPYTFIFKDADISQVADQILGQTLGVTYVVDPAVTGKISFRIDQRLTESQLLEAFEAELESNDIALVREGQTLILKPISKAKIGASVRTPEEAKNKAGYEVVAVPLSFATASEVAKALESISPANIVVYSNDKTGLLLLGGSGQELASALDAIKLFDQNGLAEAKIRWFELDHAPAQTVADDLKKVLDAAGVSGVSVVPLKRLNGLFVFARSREAIDQTERWVTKLDTPSMERTASLWTYHPRNVAAEDLAETLGGLLGGAGAGGLSGGGAGGQMSSSSSSSFQSQGQVGSFGGSQIGGQLGGTSSLGGGLGSGGLSSQNFQAPAMGSVGGYGAGQGQRQTSFSGSLGGADGNPIKVSVDRTSNTILISAPASDWTDIHKTLVELDHAPAQILIEATIVEVTLSDSFKFGVDWGLFGGNGRFSAQGITSAAGAIATQTPGFSLTYLDKDVKAALNTLQTLSDVQVVSAPKIIALDNHPASLEVGDQVPIISQTQQSTSGTGAPLVNTVEYRSTGVILNVTPRVTGDDKVALTISQEVSAVDSASSSSISSPSIQQRHFTSSVILQSGKTVALGGLISSTKSRKPNSIPYASSIPFLGTLFTNTSNSSDKTELIVLLSAKILADQAASDHVLSDLLADMKDIKIRGLVKSP